MALKKKSEQCRLLLKSKDKKKHGTKTGGTYSEPFFEFF